MRDPTATADVPPAYAVYFDHRRRTDPEFRKNLKKEARRQARMAKEEEEAQGQQQRAAIKKAVEQAKEDGFPDDLEEREAFFMAEVARGETKCTDGALSLTYIIDRSY